MSKKLKFEDKLLMENYFLNYPIKFFVKPKKLRDLFVAAIEVLKIVLGRLGILSWSYNERLIERPFVFQNLPTDNSSSILDFGCSDSIMPIEIAALGYETYGCDLKQYPYTHPNFKFMRCDIAKINIPENSLDCIACISVIEHVGLNRDYAGSDDNDVRKDKLVMGTLHNLLKHQGTLILTTMFGTKRVSEKATSRVYDSEEIKWLCSDFKILKQRHFYSNNGDWMEADPTHIETVTKDNYSPTVVTLLLQKT